MKRLRIVTAPTAVSNLNDIDTDAIVNTWQLKAERLQIRRLRKFHQQIA